MDWSKSVVLSAQQCDEGVTVEQLLLDHKRVRAQAEQRRRAQAAAAEAAVTAAPQPTPVRLQFRVLPGSALVFTHPSGSAVDARSWADSAVTVSTIADPPEWGRSAVSAAAGSGVAEGVPGPGFGRSEAEPCRVVEGGSEVEPSRIVEGGSEVAFGGGEEEEPASAAEGGSQIVAGLGFGRSEVEQPRIVDGGSDVGTPAAASAVTRVVEGGSDVLLPAVRSDDSWVLVPRDGEESEAEEHCSVIAAVPMAVWPQSKPGQMAVVGCRIVGAASRRVGEMLCSEGIRAGAVACGYSHAGLAALAAARHAVVLRVPLVGPVIGECMQGTVATGTAGLVGAHMSGGALIALSSLLATSTFDIAAMLREGASGNEVGVQVARNTATVAGWHAGGVAGSWVGLMFGGLVGGVVGGFAGSFLLSSLAAFSAKTYLESAQPPTDLPDAICISAPMESGESHVEIILGSAEDVEPGQHIAFECVDVGEGVEQLEEVLVKSTVGAAPGSIVLSKIEE
eukprot:TRINITY_DN30671_c0_g1_i1.p1 TRINITY_DN30671_c0_g1~~TRINITY_DN30671_c0_g1_i1.p1  ORF type:complete len:508 (+),score=162.49 TRINITY_DN30671_c0_g1_i1:66-1589(+)